MDSCATFNPAMNAMHPGANFEIGPIQRASSDRRKRLRRIRRLADQAPSYQRSVLLRREGSQYARSPIVRRAILSSLPQFHHWDYDRLRYLVDHLDPQAPCTTNVAWRTEPKSGGERYVCVLPAQAYLGQVLARNLVVAQLRPDAKVFDWSGRGRHRYANALGRAIERHGPFVAVMDIVSCHQSVDPDALYELSLLPTELIRWSLDHRNLSFRRVDEHQSTDCSLPSSSKPTGPRGLLQGGPASSALLTALIGHSVTELRQAYCQSYSDNFAVVGRDFAGVQQAAGELTRIVAGYHVGRLEFHPYEVIDARDGFQQLGFDFKLVDHRVRIAPNTGNTMKMLKRIEECIAVADSNDLALGAAAFIEREAATYRAVPNICFSDVEEAVDEIWREEVERRLPGWSA